MDTIQELRRVLEIHLNYMDRTKKKREQVDSPLATVKQDINRYKKQLEILTPVAIFLAFFTSIAAFASVLGAAWIPWEYMGIMVIASFVTILPAVKVYQKLELVKKRELFLFMLHKINQPSRN